MGVRKSNEQPTSEHRTIKVKLTTIVARTSEALSAAGSDSDRSPPLLLVVLLAVVDLSQNALFQRDLRKSF